MSPTEPWPNCPAPEHLPLYRERRARLAAQLEPGAIALIPTAPPQLRNRGNEHPYRFDSYFYYLCGFTEPHATLLLRADGHCTLFCQPKDREREIWDGLRLGHEAAPAALGLDAAYPSAELAQRLPALLENCSSVCYPFAVHPGLESRIEAALQQVRARARFGALCPTALRDLCAPLDEMRLFKDAHEQALMRRAAQISADAHIRAMRLAVHELRAGRPVYEYQLEAELLHAFRSQGASGPAYGSIVAAGANACVLHYRADAAALRAGELVLIDAGCELHGYASDITRTFPASGCFSAAQRDLYQLVLAAQQAAVAATRPGARFADVHQASVRVLAQGLLDLRLLDGAQVGTLDDVIEQRHYFRFYMHRTSHWLGLDVHDVGSTVEPGEIGQPSVRRDPLSGEPILKRPSRILRPGMVLTLEPGLYVRPADDVPAAFWNQGLRIEDDALLTADGCELLSRAVPVEPDAIEALLRD